MTDFFKYHALGNDYLVMEPARWPDLDNPAAIMAICHRHWGPGSDGILYGPIWVEGPEGKPAAALRIFNPDGSEAEKSGNGLRIFARHLWEFGHVKTRRFPISTRGGWVWADILDEKGHLVAVDMGLVTFASAEIPLAGPPRVALGEVLDVAGERLTIYPAGVGNPHCVVRVETPTPALAQKFGPVLEHHPLFPNRTNVQFMTVVDEHTISIEIWERGAGYTLASGSSSCAAAAVACRMGWVSSPVTVNMPGGQLHVEVDPTFSARQRGPVKSVCQGILTPEFKSEFGL